MTAIGVDYGEKRTGLAVSDALGLFAHGLPTLVRLSEDETAAEVARLAEERQAQVIVVGLPRNMDGSLGPQALKTIDFARKLASKGLAVKMVDERLTSEQARRALDEAEMTNRQKRGKVDRMAAQFILRMFLDSKGAAGQDISVFSAKAKTEN